jgi:hypothetical protein
VPGAARAGPARSAAPVLSDSVLERIQAAVEASRTQAAPAASDPITEPIPRIAATDAAAAKSPARPAPGGTRAHPARRRRPGRARPAAAAPESVPEVPTRTVPTPAAEIQPLAPARRQPAPPAEPAGQPEPAALPRRTAAPGATRQPAPQDPADAAASPRSPAPSQPPPDTADKPRVAAEAPAPPGRRAGPAQPARRRRRRPGTGWLAAAAIVIVAVVAGGVALLTQAPRQSANDHKLTPLQREAMANRGLATAWITHQVTPGTSIACDRQMCSALAASGYLTRDLHILGSTTPAPLSSSLVVETAAVRSQFGSSLDSAIAPLAIATIGTGPARISIRMVAPHGVAAFWKALAEGLKTRKQNEAAVPGGGQITTSAAAQAVLASGGADMRLVLAIASLAAAMPVDILGFGNEATGAGPGVPLRYADLAESDRAAHLSSKAYEAALLAAMRTIPGPYQPLWTKSVRLSSGATVLRLDLGAPSPFGVPGSANG